LECQTNYLELANNDSYQGTASSDADRSTNPTGFSLGFNPEVAVAKARRVRACCGTPEGDALIQIYPRKLRHYPTGKISQTESQNGKVPRSEAPR